MHACDIEDIETILSDPSSFTYPEEIDRILSGSKYALMRLLDEPEHARSKEVPAKRWLEEMKMNITRGIVPFVGRLTIMV